MRVTDSNISLFVCICTVDIGFGAGVTIDVDKEVALRLKEPEDPRRITYGRISRDDFKKIINKKDLFLICAAVAGGLTSDKASVGISLPDGKIAEIADKFIPKLVIGGIDAIVKKEVIIGNTSKRKGRKMKEADRRRLEGSIAPDSHRALRMLSSCVDDVLPDGFDPSCLVSKNGFACAKLSNIEIDADGLEQLVDKTLGKLVVPDYKKNGLKPGFFDEIANPLLILDDRLPGISDLAKKRWVSCKIVLSFHLHLISNHFSYHFHSRVSILDIAELSPKAAKTVPTIRKVISLYKNLVEFYKKFSNGDNILVAESCTFTPENG